MAGNGNNPVIELPPVTVNIDLSSLDQVIEKMEKIHDLSESVVAIMPIDDYLIRKSDVAQILGVNPDTVSKLIKNGYLKALKLGNVKIRKKELDRFMQYVEENGCTFDDIY